MKALFMTQESLETDGMKSKMMFEIDFDSGEALYLQLRNQIILGIAGYVLQEGDTLPPVRRLAGEIGINMHTVNKAYTMLKEEGFLSIDNRGAVIAMDVDKKEALAKLEQQLTGTIARAVCQGISRQEIHEMVDEICGRWS